MILMWLGSFVLALVGFVAVKQLVGEFLNEIKNEKLKQLGKQSELKDFLSLTISSLLSVSPQQNLTSALGTPALDSRRSGVLALCLNNLGVWLSVVLGFLFMNLNGLFVLGLSTLGLVSFLRKSALVHFFKLLFAIGLFLVGGDMMLKNTSTFMNSFSESSFLFLLADGRFSSVLMLLLFSLVITMIVQVEQWSLLVTLGLSMTGILSLNGAIGLLTGEICATSLMFWLQSRKSQQLETAVRIQFILFSILGALLGMLLAGELRISLGFGFSSEMNSLQAKSFQVMVLFVVIHLIQWLTQMMWGHFFCQKNGLRLKT